MMSEVLLFLIIYLMKRSVHFFKKKPSPKLMSDSVWRAFCAVMYDLLCTLQPKVHQWSKGVTNAPFLSLLGL